MHAVDTQTLYELQLESKSNKENSILNYFDRTKTEGGREILKKLLHAPKKSISEIHSFHTLLKFVSGHSNLWTIDLSRVYVAASESYYTSNIAYSMSQDVFQHYWDTFWFSWRNPAEFYIVQSGLVATLKIVRYMRDFTSRFEHVEIPEYSRKDFEFLRDFLHSSAINSFLKTEENKITIRNVYHQDYYFRVSQKESFRRLLDIFYTFDAYSSIVLTQQKYSLSFPVFATQENTFEATNLWHPLIANPVCNTIKPGEKTSLCLLSGANTSGKTTFLKACGIAVYLAHLGWPVPAVNLRLSFFDALFTSVHLSDNLELGYSHFYNEMVRIKLMAEALNAGTKCMILIDELFRGTNQEDAYECSRLVINGFLNFPDSVFLVSTHIYELLESFKTHPEISFRCFRTVLLENDFENTYQIEEGIASEKIGQLILKKSGIPELLYAKLRSK